MTGTKREQLEEAKRKHASNPTPDTQKEVERLQREADDEDRGGGGAGRQ